MSGETIYEFPKPYLLLCEGEADKRFFDKLLLKSVIDDSFQVRFPNREGEKTGGRSKFGKYLNAASTSESFIRNVKAILIVSDNDLNPATSFSEVQSELAKASMPVPAQQRTVARLPNKPAVVVMMIPFNDPGGLENLCLPSIYDNWNLKNAIDAFVSSVPAGGWDLMRQSKMRVQCALAATCYEKPDVSFAGHWRIAEQYHVPIDHSCFDDILSFLSGFNGLLSMP